MKLGLNFETIGLILTIGGILIAILIASWQNKKSLKLAKESGAFDKAQLEVAFFDNKLKSGETYKIIYGLGEQMEKALFEFPIEMSNSGTKSLKDIVLMYTFGKQPQIGLNHDFYDVSIPIQDDSLTRKYFESEDDTCIRYSLKQINPNVTHILPELLLFSPTKNTITVLAKTKDAADILIEAIVEFKYVFKLAVTATDHLPFICNVEINVIRAVDDKAFNLIVSQAMLNQFAQNVSKNPKDALKNSSAFAIFPNFESISSGIYIGKADKSVFGKLGFEEK